MKQFIKNSLIFTTILLFYFGANSAINYYIYNTQPIPLKKKHILIVGDSHVKYSLNPGLFSSAQNISQSAEPYIITYWKLKKIVTSFIPDTVIIGFATHNISQFNDLKFSNNKWSTEMFKRCYPIEHFNEIENDITIDYLSFYKILSKQVALYPKRNHINYIGSYSNSKASRTNNWKAPIQRHFFSNGEETGVSNIAINYLDSIVTFCKLKKVELILVSTPVHKNYLDNIPPSILEKYTALKNKYKDEIIILDKAQTEYPDSLYLSPDHLNEYGANKFTSEVIEYLKELRDEREIK